MEIEAITCHQTKKSFQNQNEIYDENFKNYHPFYHYEAFFWEITL